MTNKLSDSKINKIIEYKNAGYSQHQTATKLHVNQSTVCHYWNKFDTLAQAEGLETATGKYGGGDVTDLNALAADLKKENCSIPDAKAGLKVHLLLQKLEVDPEDYESVIKACLKINEKCFLETAAELDELEEQLGKSGLDVISDLKDKDKQLQEAQGELDKIYVLIKSTKKELDGLTEQRQAAIKEFEQHMKYLGLTLYRLKLVENLSLVLKEAGIPDEAIGTYLERQAILDEAKVDIALFASIVSQAKAVTALDGGQGLLGSLKEYGNLSASNAALGVKQETLKESLTGLQQQAALKGKLEGEVAVLGAQKTALEPYIEKLQASKDEYSGIQYEIAASIELQSSLIEQLEQRKQEIISLEKRVGGLTEKTQDLITKENKFIELNQQLAELEEKKKKREDEWQSFEGFVALVREQPLEGLELFAAALPSLIEGVRKGEYRALTLRNGLVEKLTGTELELPMCYSCPHKQAKIEPPKPKNIPALPASIRLIEDKGPS